MMGILTLNRLISCILSANLFFHLKHFVNIQETTFFVFKYLLTKKLLSISQEVLGKKVPQLSLTFPKRSMRENSLISDKVRIIFF